MYDKNHYNIVISLQLVKINEKIILYRVNLKRYYHKKKIVTM